LKSDCTKGVKSESKATECGLASESKATECGLASESKATEIKKGGPKPSNED